MKWFLGIVGFFVIVTVAAIWMHSDQNSTQGDIVATSGRSSPEAVKQKNPKSTPSKPTAKQENHVDIPSSAVSENMDSPRNDDTVLAALNPDYPTLDSRLNAMSARRGGQTFDPDEVSEALEKPAAWQTGDAPGDKLTLSDEEINDGREFIRFDRLRLETLVKGDVLDLPMTQTKEKYSVKINKTSGNEDGSVTWYGRLMDEKGPVLKENGGNYDVSFTSGQKVASGGIFTPEGHFVIHSVDDQGWIATSRTMYKQNGNEPCVLTPGENTSGEHQD